MKKNQQKGTYKIFRHRQNLVNQLLEELGRVGIRPKVELEGDRFKVSWEGHYEEAQDWTFGLVGNKELHWVSTGDESCG